MEGAQCFIEVYKILSKGLFHSPDYSENATYTSPINELVEDLRFTSSIGLKTIAVWYIKPKVKSL